MADPCRDYLRKRRSGEPGVPVQQLLREIRGLGYPGSSNLLVRYLNQGRADAPRSHLPPRKAVQLLLSKPDNLNDSQRATAARLTSSCPELKALASLIGSFAALLVPGPANEERLVQWIAGARAADLPNLRSFTRGLDLGIKAVTAALTLPHHNGRTEGVNCIKTKMLKRQMFGRAGFDLLRHRILLGLRSRIVTTENATEPLKLQARCPLGTDDHRRVLSMISCGESTTGGACYRRPAPGRRS
jgi:hypothetical protein